jgi:hypothetical protein
MSRKIVEDWTKELSPCEANIQGWHAKLGSAIESGYSLFSSKRYHETHSKRMQGAYVSALFQICNWASPRGPRGSSVPRNEMEQFQDMICCLAHRLNDSHQNRIPRDGLDGLRGRRRPRRR